jgi:outer membrane protein TolC
MPGYSVRRRFPPNRILLGFLLPVLIGLLGSSRAADVLPVPDTVVEKQPVKDAQPARDDAATPLLLDLEGCRRLALERQPALAAYRASVANGYAKIKALENLGSLAEHFRKDLPFRRQQAAIGVSSSEARLHQAEWETVYAVTRMYWTLAYARSQLRLADQAFDPKSPTSLTQLKTKLEDRKFRRLKGYDKWAVTQLDGYLDTIRGRREEAVTGIERALAGLREAIGLPPGCPLQIKDDELPVPKAKVDREWILKLALDRRGEIVQVSVAVEVIALEVCAQSLINSLTAQTFASGSDLHAQPIPTGSSDGEYRPAAVGIEMPANVAGSRCVRVEQIQALHGRALAVQEKTRGLIALEASDAFLKWQQASEQVVHFDRAVANGRAVAQEAFELFASEDPDVKTQTTVNDVILAYLKAGLFQGQAAQARLNLLLSLAALERVTAGGYCPDYSPTKTNNDKEKNDKSGENNNEKNKSE